MKGESEGASGGTSEEPSVKLRIISYNCGGFGGNDVFKAYLKKNMLNDLISQEKNEGSIFLIQEHHKTKKEDLNLDQKTMKRYLSFFASCEKDSKVKGGCWALFPKEHFKVDSEVKHFDKVKEGGGSSEDQGKFSVACSKNQAFFQIFRITRGEQLQMTLCNVHLQQNNEKAFLQELNSPDKDFLSNFLANLCNAGDFNKLEDSLTNLCIAGDFNKEVINPQHGNSKWKGLKLTNLWGSKKYPKFTHRKGTGEGKRIDHFLCNDEWIKNPPESGAFWWHPGHWEEVKGTKEGESRGQEGAPDHRPIVAEFDLKMSNDMKKVS